MSEKPIEISGGKMLVGGVEFQKTGGEDVVSGTVNGEACVISAGIIYLDSGADYRCVGSVPYAEFKAWRDGQK